MNARRSGARRSGTFISIPQLAALRKRVGLSQRDLAEWVGVSMNTISRLERGARARSDTIALLAQALHIPPTRLCRRPRRRPPKLNKAT